VFLPIGTDRSLKRPTLVNHALIGLCVLVFFIQLVTQQDEQTARWQIDAMLRPGDLVWWNFVSYQFLHGGFMHLLGNMLFLWVFGPNIEDRIGRLGHLGLFLVGGVAAGALHATFDDNPVIGASGSIAAITGAYMVFFPRTHIRVLLFFFIIGVYSIPSIWFIGFAIARDLFWTGVGGTNVATLAHLGGYAFGFSVAMALLASHVVPREPYDLFSLGRQAKRRREFKAVAASGRGAWSGEPPRENTRRDPRAERESEEIARRRHAISTAARENDREQAMKLYIQLAGERPEMVMNRAMQLDLAGWLFESGRHAEADEAYERFLRKNPGDAEAPKVRLLSALIRQRYLGETAGALERLENLDEARLSEQEAALYRSLLEEARG